MVGKKERLYALLMQVSLEDLVAADHFYRRLKQMLDLSSVREFVHQTYAGISFHSIGGVRVFQAPTGHVN
jgi:hypothetical protein